MHDHKNVCLEFPLFLSYYELVVDLWTKEITRTELGGNAGHSHVV